MPVCLSLLVTPIGYEFLISLCIAHMVCLGAKGWGDERSRESCPESQACCLKPHPWNALVSTHKSSLCWWWETAHSQWIWYLVDMTHEASSPFLLFRSRFRRCDVFLCSCAGVWFGLGMTRSSSTTPLHASPCGTGRLNWSAEPTWTSTSRSLHTRRPLRTDQNLVRTMFGARL